MRGPCMWTSKHAANSRAAKPWPIAAVKSNEMFFTATVTSSKGSTKSSPMPKFVSMYRPTVFRSFLFHGFKGSSKRVGMPGRRSRAQLSNLAGQSIKQAFVKNSILALLVLLLAALGASAQTLDRGAVHGFVYDTSGSPIPGVKVVLTNPATSLKRELTTNAEGGYDFEALTPGQYTLVFESGNFATYTIKEIVVTIGSAIALHRQLKARTAQQSITVNTGY